MVFLENQVLLTTTVVLLLFFSALVVAQNFAQHEACPLLSLGQYTNFSAVRILVTTPAERRQVLLRTTPSAQDPVEAWVQLQTPSISTGLFMNSQECLTVISQDNASAMALLRDVPPSCDAPVLCETAFVIHDSEAMELSFGKPGFTYNPACGYTASATITANTSFAFLPVVEAVEIVPSATGTITLVGNTRSPSNTSGYDLRTVSRSAPSQLGRASAAVRCTWGNLRPYKLVNVPNNTLPAWTTSFTYSYCLGFNSVPDIHKACDADPVCLGYTTYYYGTPCKEYAYCLLYPDGNNEASADQNDRIFAIKQSREERTCAAVTTPGGNFSVWVLENYLAKSTVEIFVDGLFAGVCPPLPGNIRPLNSQCNTYALCDTGHAYANSTVTVVVSQEAAQSGCDVGAAVIIQLDSVDAAPRQVSRSSYVQSPPLARGNSDVSAFATQLIGMTEPIAYKKLSFFVRASQRFILNVTQSVFGSCRNSSSRLCPFVNLTVGGQSIQCGALEGFINGTEGLSNQCSVRFPCRDVLDLALPFTGFVTIELHHFENVSSFCHPFSAVLMVGPQPGPPQPFGFPLGMSKTAFTPLYGVTPAVREDPLSNSAGISQVYKAVYNSSSSSSASLFQTSVLNFANYSWISLYSVSDQLFQNLRLPSAQACIMDDITYGGTCELYVPHGANFATVKVLQSLQSTAFPVNVYFWNTDVMIDSVVCHQDASLIGTSASCSALSTCFERYVRQADQLDFNFVTIALSGGIPHDTTCDVAMAVMVTFEARSAETPNCSSNFLCELDHKCVSVSLVCNGVNDCSDGSDEVLCWSIYPVETDCDVGENSPGAIVSVSSPTLSSCRQQAIVRSQQSAGGVVIFSYSNQSGLCKFSANGSRPSYNTTAIGSTCYEYLRGGPTSYEGCSRIASCSNRGEARNQSNRCECRCDAVFAGAHCELYLSPQSTSTDIIVHISVKNWSDTANIALGDIEQSLEAFASWREITCLPFEPESSTSVITVCSVAGNEVAAASLRQFQAVTPYEMFAEQLSSTAYLSITACHTSFSHSDVSTVCTLVNDSAYRWLKISVAAATAPASFQVAIDSASPSACEDIAVTIADDGCAIATCIVRPPVNSAQHYILLSNLAVSVQYITSTDLKDDDCVKSPVISGFSSIDAPSLMGTSPLTMTAKSYFPFAIGAAIFFVGTAVCAVFALIELRRNEEARQARLRIANTSLSDVIRMLREVFLRPMLEENKIIDEGRLATIFAIFAYNLCAIAMLFLLLFLTNMTDTKSSFAMILEFYSDPACAESPTALTYVPFAAGLVQDGHGACDRATVTGGQHFPIFVDGICTQALPNTYATVRFGLSTTECAQSLPMTLDNGTCFGIFGAYLRVMCDDSIVVEGRFAFFRSLFTDASVSSSQRIGVTPLPSSLLPSQQSDGINVWPFLPLALPSSSQLAGRVASVASTDMYISRSADRVVVQEDGIYFPLPVTEPPMAAIEVASDKKKATDQALQHFFPQNGDLPLGFVMNGFSYSSAQRQAISIRMPLALPAESQLYFSARRSSVDIGYYYGPSTIDDGVGFTISCYVRVTDSSSGFLFAVTDALFDRETLQSPLLAQLEQFIVSSADDAQWNHELLNVYLALYFNGAGRALTLAMATPAGRIKPGEGRQVETGTWNLDDLSAPLTNGAWHQLAVILRNDNGQVKAQLVVDGRTSKSLAAWNLCWLRRPQPIVDIENTFIVTSGALTQVAHPGGMVVVGALAGAVAQLQFKNQVVAQGAILKTGTGAMRQHVDLHRDDVLNLAIVLFVFSFVFSLLTAASSGFAIAEGEDAEEADFVAGVVAAFLDVARFVVVDESGARLQPPKYEQSRRWLKLTHAQMYLFLDELDQNTTTPNRELIRVLYLTRIAQLENSVPHRATPVPSATEWESLLEWDRQAFEKELAVPTRWFETPLGPDVIHPSEEELATEQNLPANVHDRTQENDDESMVFSKRGGGVAVDLGGGFGKARDGGGGSTSTTSDAGSGSGGASQLTTEIYNMLLPVITSLQTVYVWASSVTVPGDYLQSFGKLMSTTSVDIASLARTLAPYATPLLQLLVAILLCSFMYYLCVYDNEVFDWYLARYTLRRDQRKQKMDAKKKKKAKVPAAEQMDQVSRRPVAFAASLLQCDVLSSMPNIFAHPPRCNYEYQLSALSLRQAQDIDCFCGVHDESDDETVDAGFIEAEDVEGNKFSLSKSPPPNAGGRRVDKRRRRNPASELSLMSTDVPPKECTPFLEVAGCYCRHHPNRLLSGQVQNSIWPFENPPKCCLVNNGVPCGETNGLIFSCGAIHLNDKDELAVCDFALCQRHCRFSQVELILSQFVALTRLVRQRGFRWLLAALLLIVANAAYMPFMKTVLMILACHPFYQCTFKCWNTANQLFVIAAFLCIFIFLILGVGLPLLQAWLLRRRRALFEIVFFSDEYVGEYLEKTDDIMKQLDQMTPKKVLIALVTGQGVKFVYRKILQLLFDAYGHLTQSKKSRGRQPRLVTEEEQQPSPSTTAATSHSSPTPIPEDDRDVSVEEWQRFLACDPSAMAVLYNTLELKYMYMTPIFLLCKVILICPVVFLEPESYKQRLAMMIVELLYAALIFGTAPFVSPVVDAMYRIASIHQLLLLGLQNLDTVNTIDGKGSLGTAMMATSFVYLAICVVCMVYTSIYPALVQIRDVKKSHRMLSRLGLHYSMTTSLYVSPVVGVGEKLIWRDCRGIAEQPIQAAAQNPLYI